MTHICPYGAPCPKCGRIGLADRHQPEVTKEAYHKATLLFTEDQKKPYPWRELPTSPQEEHLVRKCQCGHLFWTRTKDMNSKRSMRWKILTAYPGTRRPHEPECHLEVVEAHDSDLVVCRFYGTSMQNQQEASLVAAAPELLEACKTVLECMPHEGLDCADEVAAAIAKAEGT